LLFITTRINSKNGLRFNEGGETMIDTVQAISRRKAKEYLEKKDKQKKMKRNIITGLIFLTALVLLIIFY